MFLSAKGSNRSRHDSPIAQGQRPEQISPHRQKGCLGARWIVKGHEHGSNGDSDPPRTQPGSRNSMNIRTTVDHRQLCLAPLYHSMFFLIALHYAIIHIYPFNTNVSTPLRNLDEEILELLGGWLYQTNPAITLYGCCDQRLY
jgi:hypothetical protein